MTIKNIIKHGLWTLLSLVVTAVIVLGTVLVFFEEQVPDVEGLKDAPLQVPLMVYTSDGLLIGEYGPERRSPIPIEKVPKQLINAVIATEDQRFYEHSGIDPIGLLRAAIEVATTGKKSQGGGTITMQVARNYFLNHQKTYSRKIKEILLAIKIDHTFTKEKILELYLNDIYFGSHAYGVAAAAQVYYGKPLDQLTLAQLAMLAGLPQAPSRLNPIVNPIEAKLRRDHVLQRMYERGYIDKATYLNAVAQPETASYHGQAVQAKAPYVAEMVRDAMYAHYGDNAYTQGFKVYTTIDSHTQTFANHAVRNAILAYDQRHGYRGPAENLGKLTSPQVLAEWIQHIATIPTFSGLFPAVVTKVNSNSAIVVLGNGKNIEIPWKGMVWARKELNAAEDLGPVPTQASNIVRVGDVVRVIRMQDGSFHLAQLPTVEGSLVAVNPQTGAIQALVGGFDYYISNFNRVTQAFRQPGSGFKPFLYSAALDRGYTLASVINDAPLVFNDPGDNSLWRPQNDEHKFYGPTRLRVALSRSSNTVSIRLLENIGIGYALHYAARFGFDPEKLPRNLTLALGTAALTPLQMVTGYAVFANGGYQVNPYIIDQIINQNGQIIYQAKPKIACEECINSSDETSETIDSLIPADQQAVRVLTPQTAYLMTSALQDVIHHGTGRGALVLKRNDLAGKTGTTDTDAWFSGFNSDIVTTTWIGFDQSDDVNEHGAVAALPMWVEFMQHVLMGKPEHSMQQPPNIVSVRIDPRTGLLAQAGQGDAIFELFRQDNVPSQVATPGMDPTSADSANLPAPLF